MSWTLHGDGRTIADGDVVRPGERLSWPRTIGFGGQHVVAMFGATFLVPLLTGFPPSTTLFFSGVGTILFLLLTGNRLPSYLGSSFAFIAPIQASMQSDDMAAALFGLVVTGLLLAAVGALVIVTGTRWIEVLMPPVVTGAIIALIGLNLSGAATDNYKSAPWIATITLATIVVVAVAFRGLIARLSILIGVVVGYIAAAIGGELDFSAVGDASWIGWPEFTSPSITWSVVPMFLPVVLVLVAENVGHVRSVAHLTEDPSLNQKTGPALLADGLATSIAGMGGGSATTTYGENIGVMTATRVFSTAAYWVAAVVAIALGMSPKFGALLNTIPSGVLGGVTVALYGLIGLIGVKIWMDNHVDFTQPINQYTAAIALVIGIGDLTLSAGDMTFTGIALGTIAAIVVFHAMRLLQRLRA
ncbi:uracil-xanthine permease family protein [Aeromicrobium wangtongii]|uniref:NCS2 family nucleobase:cation symporter n=1 Tax=Aeromicrobium wangtongii TaxID=2969247 RepID=A0ABY5M970_9ACTN|nr:solute carrier family 23 protein [Aeromicrobium wangtongii]MCD9199923.1 NCS2 family nucleobase:cation symporter [Aeromicrobium wangtongii]UUP13540.1 NCS2 family nucleobase:cation symporter [Aeromicrobium wangtongii]